MDNKKWTTIYDDGFEEVLIHATRNGNLEWEYRDWDGALEEMCWHRDMPTNRVFEWQRSHKINSETFSRGEYSTLWEEVLDRCRNAHIADLVDEIRRHKFLRA